MDIYFKKRSKTLIAELSGDIDHHSSEDIRRLTERELYVCGAKNLIIDMSNVKFMDSSGIGVIIGRYKTITALGGTTAIAAPSKEADRLLAMSGIYRIIRSYPTVDEAVKSILQEVKKQ